MDDIQNLIEQEQQIKEALKELNREYDEKETKQHKKYETAMRELAEKLNNKEAFIKDQIEQQKQKLDTEIKQKYGSVRTKEIDSSTAKKLEEILQKNLFASLKKN